MSGIFGPDSDKLVNSAVSLESAASLLPGKIEEISRTHAATLQQRLGAISGTPPPWATATIPPVTAGPEGIALRIELVNNGYVVVSHGKRDVASSIEDVHDIITRLLAEAALEEA